MREERKAGIHPWQCITLSEQRKNQFVVELQQPMAKMSGVTISCYDIDFEDEEWLRNIIRSQPVLEELYQEIKKTIAAAVSIEYFGDHIERTLLEQEFGATINAEDQGVYLESLKDAVQTMVDGRDISSDFYAQRAYDSLNQCREEISKIIASKRIR